MTAAALTFLSPSGAFVAVVALAALGLSARRAERAALVLRLKPAGRRPLALPAAFAVATCALLGLAAAQPALRTTHRQELRTQSQVFFVVDVSRSMAAASTLTARTRLEQARTDVARLRAAIPDVPSGLAGLTDRVLPFLFPTASSAAFEQTLRRSVTIEAPPPQQVSTNATSFAALSALARDGFFDHTATHRVCVVVTDGESRSYSTGSVSAPLDGPKGCRLLVVRVGGAGERVFGADGTPEAAYAPDPAAAAKAQELAVASGGRAFSSGDLGQAEAALRSAAEAGPVSRAPSRATIRPLAPFAAGLALALALALVLVRLRGPVLHLIRTYA